MTATDSITTQTGLDAVEASDNWIDRIIKDAADDDVKLLELIREHLAVCKKHVDRIREVRAEAIVRARAAGVSNIELQDYTGLSDSGISRAALAAGAPRRVNRRRSIERRNGPPPRQP